MTSPISLAQALTQIGLRALPEELEDFLARAAKGRWSPHQILEELARRSLERRLRSARIGRFKSIADFDWNWPKKIDRELVERALTLDFIPEARNLILLGSNGLGKTMIAKNIAHAAVSAGYSVLFRTASEILDDLQSDSPELQRRRLKKYARPALLYWATWPTIPMPPTCFTRSSIAAMSTGRCSSPPIVPSATGAWSFPMPPASPPCWTASPITPISPSSKAPAIG